MMKIAENHLNCFPDRILRTLTRTCDVARALDAFMDRIDSARAAGEKTPEPVGHGVIAKMLDASEDANKALASIEAKIARLNDLFGTSLDVPARGDTRTAAHPGGVPIPKDTTDMPRTATYSGHERIYD